MQPYEIRSLDVYPCDHGTLYLRNDVDARIAELEKALKVLWHEVCEAGLGDARDYNWPQARELTTKALSPLMER